MIAVGVASPRAQGLVITNTASAATMAVATARPVSSQPAHVSAAGTTTTGTKTAERRSAKRCTGAWPLLLLWLDLRHQLRTLLMQRLRPRSKKIF